MLILIFALLIILLIIYYLFCENKIEEFECSTVNSSELYKNRDDIKYILSRLSNMGDLRNKINENKSNIKNTKNESKENNKSITKISESLKHL